MGARFLEQAESPDHVGLDELARTMDRAVDVALGSEMKDRARPMLGQQPSDQGAVADVALNQLAYPRLQKFSDGLSVACVGQLVQHEHRFTALREPVVDEVASDEAGGSGDQQHSLVFR